MIKTSLTILLLCAVLFNRLNQASARSTCDTLSPQIAELLGQAQTDLSNNDVDGAKNMIGAAQLLLSGCGQASTSSTPVNPATPAPGALKGRIVYVAGSSGDIAVMNADGSDVQDLGIGGTYPSWSPDGTQFVFQGPPSGYQAYLGGSALYVVNADGSNTHELELGSIDGATQPSWSPDGKQIAFVNSSLDESEQGVYLYQIADQEITKVSNDEVMTPTAWSPDSARLAYPLYENSQNYIKVLHLDGSPADTYLMPGRVGRIAWDPNGQDIVFEVSGTVRGDDGLYMMNTDGSNIHLIGANAFAPAWSPDGQYLLFTANSNLYAAKLGGQDAILIAKNVDSAQWAVDPSAN